MRTPNSGVPLGGINCVTFEAVLRVSTLPNQQVTYNQLTTNNNFERAKNLSGKIAVLYIWEIVLQYVCNIFGSTIYISPPLLQWNRTDNRGGFTFTTIKTGGMVIYHVQRSWLRARTLIMWSAIYRISIIDCEQGNWSCAAKLGLLSAVERAQRNSERVNCNREYVCRAIDRVCCAL